MRRPAALAAALLVAAVAAPAPARAVEASGDEVRTLARAAARDDAAALRRLRAIDRVDGRPVALGRALGGDAADVRARLELLAAAPAAGPADPAAAARREAADVLGARKYRESDLPQPLRRPFTWLGDRLRDVSDWLTGAVPGGGPVAYPLLALLVLLAAALVASRWVRRRVAEETFAAVSERQEGEDPRALERAADAAERDGDFARAIRLRFRAGLLDLDAAEVVELRPGLTTGAIARQVRSPAFDAVRAVFDEVAYGDREATADDAAAARADWKRVRREVRGGERVAA